MLATLRKASLETPQYSAHCLWRVARKMLLEQLKNATRMLQRGIGAVVIQIRWGVCTLLPVAAVGFDSAPLRPFTSASASAPSYSQVFGS